MSQSDKQGITNKQRIHLMPSPLRTLKTKLHALNCAHDIIFLKEHGGLEHQPNIYIKKKRIDPVYKRNWAQKP